MIIRIFPFVIQGAMVKHCGPELIPDIYFSTEDRSLYIDFLYFQIEIIYAGFIQK